MKPGIYPNITNEDYHNSDGISKTKLDLFAIDQSLLEWSANCPVDEDKLKTLDFGDAMHAICLEPDRLENDFVVMPDIEGRSNAGKAERAAFIAEHQDKKILTAVEYKKLQLMFGSVMAHPGARYLIEQTGIAEQSYFWEDAEIEDKQTGNGLLCKCRPDKILKNVPVIVDVKTTDSIENFERYSIDDYRYYVQHPFYLDGCNAHNEEKELFIFLVIQKTIELGRYPVILKILPQKAIDYGRSIYKENLRAYATAKATGDFKELYEVDLSYNLNKKIDQYFN